MALQCKLCGKVSWWCNCPIVLKDGTILYPTPSKGRPASDDRPDRLEES